MAILKKGSYTGNSVSNFDYSKIDLMADDNTDNIKFDKNEYIALLEDAKKEGYDAGLKNGYEDGYNQGMAKFEEIKAELNNSLENDKSNLVSFLQLNSAEYINLFQSEIKSLILNSINKIFLNTLKEEETMKVYLSELTTMLLATVKEFSLTLNAFTLELIKTQLEEKNILYTIDESIDNYNLLVSAGEHREYYLKDEFNKIAELFN